MDEISEIVQEGEKPMLIKYFEGIIWCFPDIMLELEHDVNDTTCLCQDLQTEDYSPLYALTNYTLIIIALPFLSLFGVFTNIVNIFLYSRRQLRNSANTYLLFLACSDFLVILTGLFVFWIDSARSYIPELARAPYTTVYVLPFGYMAQSCSIYFTVAAAFECYINVCWHSLAKGYCTVARAKQICYTIVVISIMYNSLRLPQFNLRKCLHESSGEQIIEICPTTLFSMINTVYNVYMYMVLMTLLPFFFLLCLNAIIVMRQNATQSKTTLESTNSTNDLLKPTLVVKQNSVGSSDDTIVMIMVVVLFLCCNTLALIVNVVERFLDSTPLFINLITDVSNFLVIFNSSVNCVIYLVFNRQYRELFRLHATRFLQCTMEFRCCCCCRPSRQRLYQPVNTQNLHEKPYTDFMRNNNNLPFLEQYGTTSNRHDSPIWQPLTQRSMENFNWSGKRSASCDPNSPFLLLIDEDGDSGMEDAVSSQANVSNCRPMTRWLAEVNIMDNESGGQRPKIVVKPIHENSRRSPSDALSITAL